MLNLGEIKTGRLIQLFDQPYLVIKADRHKIARGGAVLKTKLKNLINGSVLDKTFQGNDKAEEAKIEKKKASFLYEDGAVACFMDNENFEQFEIELDQLAGKLKFLKDGIGVDVMYFQNKPVAVDLPVKIELKVVSAPLGVKGNTVSNVNKTVKLETGVEISTPIFINEGDVIRVNTDTGEYVERV